MWHAADLVRTRWDFIHICSNARPLRMWQRIVCSLLNWRLQTIGTQETPCPKGLSVVCLRECNTTNTILRTWDNVIIALRKRGYVMAGVCSRDGKWSYDCGWCPHFSCDLQWIKGKVEILTLLSNRNWAVISLVNAIITSFSAFLIVSQAANSQQDNGEAFMIQAWWSQVVCHRYYY